MREGRHASVIVVREPSGMVLYLRRSPTDSWLPGHWNFPGGLVEDTDRRVVDGAARELEEEAGISVDPSELIYQFSYRPRGVEDLSLHVYELYLPYRYPVSLTDNEHDFYTWASYKVLPQPHIPSVPVVLGSTPSK